jgi:hypothetical protein
MKRIGLLFLGLVLLLPAAPVQADHPAGATARDIRLLQDDLENLDDVIGRLDPADSRTADFRRREQRLRDEVVALRDSIQRHRRDNREGYGASKQAVDDLRQDIRTLETDIDRSYAGRYPAGDPTVAEGTRVQVRLEDALSSRTARIEDRVEATVDYPVRDSSGRIVIPAGSRVVGRVTDVDRAQRPARGGEIDIAFDTLYVGNTRYDLRGRVVSVGDEVNPGSNTGERAGIGAVLGGVLGGILGGTKGALLGVVIGGTGGVASSRGEEVELPAGTILTVELDRALSARRF